MLAQLEETHLAREEALARCRETIRACGLAIRALHRHRTEEAAERVALAESSIRKAQRAMKPFPQLAAMGFLHDAEKEFAEARLTQALIDGDALATHEELEVALPAWLNGLAEAASELRRHLLDCLRSGDVNKGEDLLETMEDVFDFLVTVEYPDAITGGLRRAADSLRAVVERSRADVTTTVLQTNLQRAIESRGAALRPEPPLTGT
ncbi:MAG: haloacid dehalogenase [Acidimicrobiales bacterium]